MGGQIGRAPVVELGAYVLLNAIFQPLKITKLNEGGELRWVGVRLGTRM